MLLTEILAQNQAIGPEVVASAPLDEVSDEFFVRNLVTEGVISATVLTQARAQKYGVGFVDLSQYQPDTLAVASLPADLCRRHNVLPLKIKENDLYLAMSNPSDILALDDVRAFSTYSVVPILVEQDALLNAIRKSYRLDGDISELTSELEGDVVIDEEDAELSQIANDAPIVRFVNLVISQAITDRASDIHIEPGQSELRIRYRIDGVLHEMQRESKKIQAGVISRIKIMSDIDIAERRKPQDGRMTFRNGDDVRDLRVATLPTVWGEKIIMRILDTGSISKSVSNLGMLPQNKALFDTALQKSNGMILVTGPTGSGKSTTLYAALAAVQNPSVNIITVEDPVEYRMADINQIQVNQRAGLTFSSALRSILRADPDIILLGEIRDKETAQIALEASLTGHLVLSTLHTNDAPSSMMRLIELGVEPFLVASSVSYVVAQRLVRRLCDKCKEVASIPPEMLTNLGFNVENAVFYKPRGCSMCSNTGYLGRLAIHEVMKVSEKIAQLTIERVSSTELGEVAESEGMTRLLHDGLLKASAGLTSIDEVLRVVA